ncbi:MAG: hypothetical protein H6742_21000 [Alphaproteobacteria bacterium]|nr:hypothetical protein [Alphaproteobacteria bacterium]
MRDLPFIALYLACLGLCIGAVELARATWEPPPPPPPPPLEAVAIAVPPKPEGARPTTGQGDEGYRYTEEGCRARDGQLRDLCFQQLAIQRGRTDLDGGLAACELIAEREVSLECRSDVAEAYSPVDRDAALAVCPAIPKKKWRDQCVFGIALAWSTLDSPWAFRLCDQAGKWRDFCRHDVNGEIAQVDVDLALEHCAAEEGDLLRRKTCWHGIGKYIARIDVDGAFAACDRVPAGPDNLYRENCIHGLGWGASETAGVGFLPTCSRAGPELDSCRLGVAYNLKRFDPGAALDICRSVGRADLKAQCEAFVGGG